MLLRLPDLFVGLLGASIISTPLACGNDGIQITTFIASTVQVSLDVHNIIGTGVVFMLESIILYRAHQERRLYFIQHCSRL